MSALLTYALNESNKFVHIDDVSNGGACGCVCPHCGKAVDAKNGGDIREHHFAHSHGNTCEGAYETTLHLLAKEILMEEKCIMLPPCEDGKFPSGLIRLHNVEQEKWDNQYGFKPDVEGIMGNGERLLIEILVTHKVQDKKRDIIVKNNLKCIEIDLGFVQMNKAKIRDFLIKDSNNRKWIMPYEKNVAGEGGLSDNKRNKWQLKAIEYLKEQFYSGTMIIGYRCEMDIVKTWFYTDYKDPWIEKYNLRKLGYDVCEPITNLYQRFSADLHLFRSQKDNNGDIVISVRGRRRNSNQTRPVGLRVIDILIRDESDYNSLKSVKCLMYDDRHIIFEGFRTPKDVELKPV